MDMMSFAEVYLTPILTVLISLIYFCTSPKEQRLYIRLAISGHGVAIAVLYVSPILIHRVMTSPPTAENIIHEIWSYFLIVPVILMFFSLLKFRGPLLVHILQIINMMGLAWTFLLGSMFLTSQWL